MKWAQRVAAGLAVAAVLVQLELLDQRGVVAIGRVQRHLHAGGGAAVHGIQYMCAQAHDVFLSAKSAVMKLVYRSVYTFMI